MPHQVLNAHKPAATAVADTSADKAPVANGGPTARRLPQKKSADELERERVDRETLVMWRRPIDTLVFAAKEAGIRIADLKQ